MRDRNMGGYEDRERDERVIWSWRKVPSIMLDAIWKWDHAEEDGVIEVSSVPTQGDGIPATAASLRTYASVRSTDLAQLQRAWDTWHAIIDDPATAPDAVLHWLAEVTPGRTETTETQEKTTT